LRFARLSVDHEFQLLHASVSFKFNVLPIRWC
jgi:hypothetical protein